MKGSHVSQIVLHEDIQFNNHCRFKNKKLRPKCLEIFELENLDILSLQIYVFRNYKI